jgi:hypothetical protein
MNFVPKIKIKLNSNFKNLDNFDVLSSNFEALENSAASSLTSSASAASLAYPNSITQFTQRNPNFH